MTFEEFWNLPEAKRATAFKELSSMDRMLVRQQQSSIGTVRVIPCNECKFRIGIMLACEAYPDGLTSNRIKSAMKHCEYVEQKVPVYHKKSINEFTDS